MAKVRPANTSGTPYLYVSDLCIPTIDVLHSRNYYEVGYIPNLGGYPYDVSVDAKGNLYVALQNSVAEYAPNNWSAPIFYYTHNVVGATSVREDNHGDVYEGDNSSGYINEYYQQQNNRTVASCQPVNGGVIFGVAIDRQNDVFATVYINAYESELVEYKGGLNNCQSLTVLPLPTQDVGEGIATDKNGNLLIANYSDVEVVDAPNYDTVNETFGSGFCFADNITLNKANTLVFVSDICNGTVTAIHYPSGTNAAVLGSGNGIIEPTGVVESPNAVY